MTIARLSLLAALLLLVPGGASAGQVGHWRLDEAAGSTAFDASGLVNDGVLTGLTSWTSGANGSASALLFRGVGTCATSGNFDLKLKKKDVDWVLTNSGSVDLHIGTITLSWPSKNEKLDKIKLDGDTFFDTDVPGPSATLSTWLGGAEKRRLEAGNTETLRFHYKKDVDKDEGLYAITVEFEEGCTIVWSVPASTEGDRVVVSDEPSLDMNGAFSIALWVRPRGVSGPDRGRQVAGR